MEYRILGSNIVIVPRLLLGRRFCFMPAVAIHNGAENIMDCRVARYAHSSQ